MKAKRGKFRIDFTDKVYDGYYFDRPDETWNGFHCPFLTYPSKLKFLEDINAFSPQEIETEDGVLLIFPLGSQQFKWELVVEKVAKTKGND